jgi:hypothetical protein
VFEAFEIYVMTLVKQCVASSVVLAGMSVLLQTISFIIPGWLITETSCYSVNMAIWYVILCAGKQNGTLNYSCNSMSYKELLSGKNKNSLSQIGKFVNNVINTAFVLKKKKCCHLSLPVYYFLI